MKAVVFSRYGGPEVLSLEERPVPVPGPGRVLVKVHATAVNDYDWGFLRGKPYIYRLIFGLTRPRLQVLGAELAGTVEVLGEGVSEFSVGDRVYGDVSEAGFGAFAEYASVGVSALVKMPDNMTFEQAAAIPHAAGLAVQGLLDVAKLQPGEQVLLNGAGGGVGVLGLQIAKHFGARVTGVDSARKLDMMRNLGFDEVIDYEQQDFTKLDERYDLILDTKTTRSPSDCVRALKPSGRYVTVGGHLPRLLQLVSAGPALRLFSSKRVAIVALKPNQSLGYINDLFQESGLKTVTDGPYPLSEVPYAMARFGAAEHLGKVVIRVP
jgi:NADPH:quinone reductase-like Zn-dependent oxidoreductase